MLRPLLSTLHHLQSKRLVFTETFNSFKYTIHARRDRVELQLSLPKNCPPLILDRVEKALQTQNIQKVPSQNEVDLLANGYTIFERSKGAIPLTIHHHFYAVHAEKQFKEVAEAAEALRTAIPSNKQILEKKFIAAILEASKKPL